MSPGKLFIVPSPISEADLKSVLPLEFFDIISNLELFFVENIRTSRRLLSRAGINNISDIGFKVLNKDTPQESLEEMIHLLRDNRNAGIMSEAGCPGIADPGSRLIMLAHQNNIEVIPIVGPSSIFLALMASGFNGQKFQFHGYLPIEKNIRLKRIRHLENLVYTHDETQIFMETPYRNLQILEALFKTLKPLTKLCVATNITSRDAFIKSMTIKKWKRQMPDIHKKPTIFLLYK